MKKTIAALVAIVTILLSIPVAAAPDTLTADGDTGNATAIATVNASFTVTIPETISFTYNAYDVVTANQPISVNTPLLLEPGASLNVSVAPASGSVFQITNSSTNIGYSLGLTKTNATTLEDVLTSGDEVAVFSASNTTAVPLYAQINSGAWSGNIPAGTYTQTLVFTVDVQ
ncbi:MAG: hypothetical protein ACK5MN_03620 [Lachnospiraceae bacterium]